MSLPPIPNAALNAYQKQASQSSQLEKTTQNTLLNAGIKEVTVRNEKQAVFVSHFFENSADKKEGALKITYKLAIEKLNEKLEAETGKKDVISEKRLKQQGGMEYWTPENVAQRIVQGTTGFLDSFQKIHPELKGEALIDKFLGVIGGGVKQGFSEAQGILKDLKVFEGDIADNYQKTYDLVQKGFEAFRNQYLGIEPKQNETENKTESTAETPKNAKIPSPASNA